MRIGNSTYPRLLSHFVLIILMTCCFFDETAASGNQEYAACKQEICGKFSIKYPFWTKSEFCGRSRFQVGCSNGQPIFDLFFGLYHIQRNDSIHYGQQFIELKANKFDAFCLPDFHYSFTPPPPSTSTEHTEPGLIYLEKGVSNLSVQVHISYGCNFTFPLPYALPLNCSKNALHQTYVAITPLPGPENQVAMTMKSACTYHYFLEVELQRSDFNRVMKTIDYKRFFRDNIILHWTVETGKICQACQSSGGECGQSEKEEFQCFCPDGSDPKMCTAGNIRKANSEFYSKRFYVHNLKPDRMTLAFQL